MKVVQARTRSSWRINVLSRDPLRRHLRHAPSSSATAPGGNLVPVNASAAQGPPVRTHAADSTLLWPRTEGCHSPARVRAHQQPQQRRVTDICVL